MIARQNNFDLIRLLAALQVLCVHCADHLSLNPIAGSLASILGYFPGVPIFFFISGFLISDSWQRTDHWKRYAMNRLLRIYPALWTCLLATIGLIVTLIGPQLLSSPAFALWVIAQATFAQFYNLESLRGIGVGVINGSLWTISVELQFYCLLPLFMVLTSGIKQARNIWFWLILSMVLREGYIWLRVSDASENLSKLIGVTLIPYFSIFCCGIVCQFHWNTIHRWFEARILPWFIGYMVWLLISHQLGIGSHGNLMSCLQYIPLCGLILATAFSYGRAAEKLLRGNDLSYGVYLYHMLAINWIIECNINSAMSRFVAVVFVSIICAAFSWLVIEKRCLGWKKKLESLCGTHNLAVIQTT